MSIQVIGWASSGILLLTLVQQVRKQWRDGRSEGVSRWLFVGQVAASLGFLIYSAALGERVFVVTNALLLINALVGAAILRKNRRPTLNRGAANDDHADLQVRIMARLIERDERRLL